MEKHKIKYVLNVVKKTHITGNFTINYMELQYVLSILNIIVAYIVCMIVASEVYKWPLPTK